MSELVEGRLGSSASTEVSVVVPETHGSEQSCTLQLRNVGLADLVIAARSSARVNPRLRDAQRAPSDALSVHDPLQLLLGSNLARLGGEQTRYCSKHEWRKRSALEVMTAATSAPHSLVTSSARRMFRCQLFALQTELAAKEALWASSEVVASCSMGCAHAWASQPAQELRVS